MTPLGNTSVFAAVALAASMDYGQSFAPQSAMDSRLGANTASSLDNTPADGDLATKKASSAVDNKVAFNPRVLGNDQQFGSFRGG